MPDHCAICKERFACDRLEYDCPRLTFPVGNDDELDEQNKRNWAQTYIKAGYKVPKELEGYV